MSVMRLAASRACVLRDCDWRCTGVRASLKDDVV